MLYCLLWFLRHSVFAEQKVGIFEGVCRRNFRQFWEIFSTELVSFSDPSGFFYICPHFPCVFSMAIPLYSHCIRSRRSVFGLVRKNCSSPGLFMWSNQLPAYLHIYLLENII